MAKNWVKFWTKNLYSPIIAKLPDWLWRRKFEFDLLAGEVDQDGALPPVEDMLWTLRLEETKLRQALQMLAEVGEVHQDPPGSDNWFMTNFAELQETPAAARMRRLRSKKEDSPDGNSSENSYANSYKNSSENSYGNSASTSTSTSTSDSGSEFKSLNALYESWDWRPNNPKDALDHPALAAFERACGGIPGERDYEKVVQWVRLIGKRYQLQPSELDDYLKRYADWWRGQIGKNGQSYDPLNVNWLLRAYNGESLDPKIVAPVVGTTGQIKTTGVLDKLSREIEAKNKRQL